MNKKTIEGSQLNYLIRNFLKLISGKIDKDGNKGLSTNDFTDGMKDKLTNISDGAEVNQNAFSNIIVGDTIIAADNKTDTVRLISGNNIDIIPSETEGGIIIGAKNIVSDEMFDELSERVGTESVRSQIESAVSKTSQVRFITWEADD